MAHSTLWSMEQFSFWAFWKNRTWTFFRRAMRSHHFTKHFSELWRMEFSWKNDQCWEGEMDIKASGTKGHLPRIHLNINKYNLLRQLVYLFGKAEVVACAWRMVFMWSLRYNPVFISWDLAEPVKGHLLVQNFPKVLFFGSACYNWAFVAGYILYLLGGDFVSA